MIDLPRLVGKLRNRLRRLEVTAREIREEVNQAHTMLDSLANAIRAEEAAKVRPEDMGDLEYLDLRVSELQGEISALLRQRMAAGAPPPRHAHKPQHDPEKWNTVMDDELTADTLASGYAMQPEAVPKATHRDSRDDINRRIQAHVAEVARGKDASAADKAN